MSTCAIAPTDKRLVAQRVGKRLVTLYGKRRNYSPQLIKAAMRRSDFPAVWDCWALSLFASRDDFDSYHAASGEACDFASMHADMLGAVGADVDTGSAFDIFSFDWLEGAAIADAAADADLS